MFLLYMPCRVPRKSRFQSRELYKTGKVCRSLGREDGSGSNRAVIAQDREELFETSWEHIRAIWGEDAKRRKQTGLCCGLASLFRAAGGGQMREQMGCKMRGKMGEQMAERNRWTNII